MTDCTCPRGCPTTFALIDKACPQHGSNVKLLPLPEMHSRFHPMDWHAIEALATDYARANVEASTEALRGQIEALKDALIAANAEAEMLRAEVRRLNFEVDAAAIYSDDRDAHYLQAEARAERLAEALREAQPFIGWVGSYDDLHAKIDALLHPTAAQEAES